MDGSSWWSRKVLVIAERLLHHPPGQVVVGQPEVLDELLVGAASSTG